jgi:uncharacterized alkaline shock family protein YloU
VHGDAMIATEVLARYAADATREIDGVRGLVASQLHRHRGVRITGDPAQPVVELHVDVEWGAPFPRVGRAVQARVRDYLERMAGASPASVDVVVAAVGPAP